MVEQRRTAEYANQLHDERLWSSAGTYIERVRTSAGAIQRTVLAEALMTNGAKDESRSSSHESVDPLTVPLIAGDSGLDTLKLGYLIVPISKTAFSRIRVAVCKEVN